MRETTADDEAALASLYLVSYGRSVVGDEAAAQEEMRVTFAGEYGAVDLAASPIIETATGRMVAAVMSVAVAPWDDTPEGPFVIEVIVDPDHRRKGLAEHAMRWVASVLPDEGTVGLRVMSENAPALALYTKLGFVPYSSVPSGP